jgi:purine-binding chemotaxis protein CheW
VTEQLPHRVVIVQVGEGLCALPISAVVETMRPATTRPLPGTPSWVSGAAVVRGLPTPVVDLAALLGGAPEGAASRWVIIRCGERPVALAVRSVDGVTTLPETTARVPLLQGAASGAVASLRALDRELLVVLDASLLVTGGVLRAATEGGA